MHIFSFILCVTLIFALETPNASILYAHHNKKKGGRYVVKYCQRQNYQYLADLLPSGLISFERNVYKKCTLMCSFDTKLHEAKKSIGRQGVVGTFFRCALKFL